LANIHLVYVRIPGKGIALYRLLWGGDDDNSEIGIGNVISKSNHVNIIRSGMMVDSGRGNGY
jgi:transketolase C-terminal domain/subunit